MKNEQFQKLTLKKQNSHQQPSPKNDLFQHSSNTKGLIQSSPFAPNVKQNYMNKNKQWKYQTFNSYEPFRNGYQRKIQSSFNINIKSNTKELIESKEYQNQFSNDQTPLHPNINQKSFESPRKQKSMKPLSKLNKLDKLKNNQIVDQFVSGNQLFPETKKYGCSFSDVEKLSQMFCQVMLKQDSKRIKQLNSTNQQLKSVCKQIVAILRKRDSDHSRNETYDDCTVRQIYRIILNYEDKIKTTV